MASHGADALIITGTDPHQSEYLAPLWQDRSWLTGFTGSSGSVLVMADKAILVTDSRYTIQAAKEIDPECFDLIIIDNKIPNGFINLVRNEVPVGSSLFLDGFDISVSQFRAYEKLLGKEVNFHTQTDLLGLSWEDRPGLPHSKVFHLTDELAGKSPIEKLGQLRSWIETQQADYFLLSSLDEIAWLLNLRGSDVEFNPVFISYLLVSQSGASLFCDETRIDGGALDLLSGSGVSLSPYGSVIGALNELPENEKLVFDPSACSLPVFQAINCRKAEAESPIALWKSKKNMTEIVLTRTTMVKDGLALANAFYWLQETLKSRTVSEFEFSEKLTACRAEQPSYVGDSFPPIVGFKGNGAIVHYRPTEKINREIHQDGVLLVDSGGQYMEGTTDITRTIALGQIPKEAKKAFTLVLKGMIALTRAVFPVGVNGAQLDILARQFLWENGLNYGHGTGHGVGFFLNVHEGPQSISPVINPRSKTPFEPGMITSNEPGYYLTDEFGIRVENLILCTPHKDYEGYLCFETLTLYPIDIAMIDEAMMSASEKAWFNNYHHKVKTLILPHLAEPVRSWFEWRCRPLN